MTETGKIIVDQQKKLEEKKYTEVKTKIDKVADVNSFAYPTNVNYQYGFERNMKYVNMKEGNCRDH